MELGKIKFRAAVNSSGLEKINLNKLNIPGACAGFQRCSPRVEFLHVTNDNDNDDSENHSARFKTAADLEVSGVF